MLQKTKRVLALVCIFGLLMTACPIPARAAAAPKYAKTYTSLYENGSGNGVYTLTVRNLIKGQTVRWSVTGSGKSYAKLKKKSTKATSTKVSNKLTIQTGGSAEAKNKIVNVMAMVYTKSGKLQCTLSSGNAKIKVKPTGIAVVSTGVPEKLLAGNSYQFNYQITPANATSSNVWTAVYSDGTDATECITRGGLFTPKREGTYTITVQAKIGTKVIASDSKTVTASTALVEVKQLSANKIMAAYSGNAKELVKKESFTLKNSAGVKEEIRDIAFSEDGKEVTLTLYSLLQNGGKYTLTDGNVTKEFTASVGKPASMKVLTTQTTVNQYTTIEYALYDANGVDVSAAYPGTVVYTNLNVMNGEVNTATNQIHMTSVGNVGTFLMTYTCKSDPALILNVTAQIVCVAPSTASKTNFTLTTTESTPNYSDASYKDNQKISSGRDYYIHFRALDTNGTEFRYDSVKFESSDPDTLMINNRSDNIARATPIKTGRVRVLVTAVYSGQNYAYSYDVEIVEASYLAGISLDYSSVYISNQYVTGYKKYINVAAKDQYGQAFVLSDEIWQITDNNTSRPNLVSYDETANRVEINAGGCAVGSYSYTLTLTVGNRKASANFIVIVQEPSYNGAVSYQVDIDNPTLDMALSSNVVSNNVAESKNVTVRVAEYRGGIFYQYITIQSARIIKDGKYYSSNLTQTPSSTAIDAVTGSQQLTVNTVNIVNNVCTKAATGVYSVELKYIPTNGSASTSTITGRFELKDSQAVQTVNVVRTLSSSTCDTALTLAQNCFDVPGGEIVDCVVTNFSGSGKDYRLYSGESVNIKSVTVQVKTNLNGQNIVSNYTVNVGKTLTNR